MKCYNLVYSDPLDANLSSSKYNSFLIKGGRGDYQYKFRITAIIRELMIFWGTN